MVGRQLAEARFDPPYKFFCTAKQGKLSLQIQLLNENVAFIQPSAHKKSRTKRGGS